MKLTSVDIFQEVEECGCTWNVHTYSAAHCKYAALKASHAGLVEALRISEWAMNYLGDQLNDMDAAFDAPEFNRVSDAFETVRAALKKRRR